MRELVRAWNDPTSLIKLSPEGPVGTDFISHLFRIRTKGRFFFSRFDLYKDSDALFTKLFSRKSGSKYEELPFREAKRNWNNFLGAVWEANQSGRIWISYTDLEGRCDKLYSSKIFKQILSQYGFGF